VIGAEIVRKLSQALELAREGRKSEASVQINEAYDDQEKAWPALNQFERLETLGLLAAGFRELGNLKKEIPVLEKLCSLALADLDRLGALASDQDIRWTGDDFILLGLACLRAGKKEEAKAAINQAKSILIEVGCDLDADQILSRSGTELSNPRLKPGKEFKLMPPRTGDSKTTTRGELGDAEMWFAKAGALSQQDRHEEALAALDMGLRMNPDNWQAWSDRGVILAKLWKWREAVHSYDRAIGIDPAHVQPWFNKGHCLAQGLTDYAGAIQCFEKAQRLGNVQAGEVIETLRRRMGNEAHALWKQALGLCRSEKFDEALELLDQALKIDPNYPQAWINKGAVLAEKGNHEQALICYDRAIQVAPMLSEAWFNKGISCLRRDWDYEAALPCFETAHKLGNPEAARYVSLCRKKLDK